MTNLMRHTMPLRSARGSLLWLSIRCKIGLGEWKRRRRRWRREKCW
uniref:Uncharacterized protein n=1 Tax=Rhizophora mucronata TaxID=61149 RepID=A0A2P2PD22_RHIMU